MSPKLGKLYNHLAYAGKLLPKQLRLGHMPYQLREMKREVASLIAQQEGVKTMSEVRANLNIENSEIAKALLCSLLEQSPESRRDRAGMLYEKLDRVGVKAALAAPVETPSEFARWLRRPSGKKKAAAAG